MSNIGKAIHTAQLVRNVHSTLEMLEMQIEQLPAHLTEFQAKLRAHLGELIEISGAAVAASEQEKVLARNPPAAAGEGQI